MPKPPTDDEDQAFFKASMKGVRRLAPTNKVNHMPKTPTKPRTKAPITPPDINDSLSDYLPDPRYSGQEKVTFFASNLSFLQQRKLRQGKLIMDIKLDLHGLTVQQAKQQLLRTLQQCATEGLRHLLIIHGKGRLADDKPRLKNYVIHWLQQHSAILAFCSAQPKDGGTGALYVLLRA